MTEFIEESEIIQPVLPAENDKKSKLFLCLLFDGIGMLSYVIPVFGEAMDIVWAPISGILLVLMFKGTVGKLAGVFGFIEELIPFVDIIPTFTITWFYTYVMNRGKGQN
jgi:hypothetical protein